MCLSIAQGQSEALRLGKNSHVQALALNPRNESQTVAVTSAGWVLLHEVVLYLNDQFADVVSAA